MNTRVIKADCQQGVSNARNSALKYAKGEYIHFYDADDVINTDFYSVLYDSAKKSDSDVAVASYINERYKHDSVIFDREFILSMPQDKIDATMVDKHGFSTRYLIKKAFWEHNRFLFPTDMVYCEDILIMTKVVYYSNRIILVPKATYVYKYRQNSMLTTRNTRKIQNIYYRRAKIDTHMFLCQFEIKSTCDNFYKFKWLLFGFLPVLTVASGDY